MKYTVLVSAKVYSSHDDGDEKIVERQSLVEFSGEECKTADIGEIDRALGATINMDSKILARRFAQRLKGSVGE